MADREGPPERNSKDVSFGRLVFFNLDPKPIDMKGLYHLIAVDVTNYIVSVREDLRRRKTLATK